MTEKKIFVEGQKPIWQQVVEIENKFDHVDESDFEAVGAKITLLNKEELIELWSKMTDEDINLWAVYMLTHFKLDLAPWFVSLVIDNNLAVVKLRKIGRNRRLEAQEILKNLLFLRKKHSFKQ